MTRLTHDSTPLSRRSAPLARIEHLSISFPGRDRPAVDDLSLEVRAGECVALVGESGSGKSLTARALLGLVPATATLRGTVFLGEDHAPPNGHPSWAALRGVRAALVPQDALGGLNPLRRLEQEVGDALRLHRILPHGEARRARTIDALAAAGMPTPEQQLRRRSDELSGGLRQRALVASALIAEPELIIADEPTTALDAGHRVRVLEELRRRVDSGAGALLVSHDLASVRDFADRVLVMRDGRIVEAGDPRTVFASPQHAFTRELIAASPAGKPRGSSLLAVGADAASSADTSSADRSSTNHPSADSSLEAPHTTSSLTTAVSHRPPTSTVDARQDRDHFTTPRLELRGIEAGFGQGAARKVVLQEVSLQVFPGETVGLVGESGSGKTTLIRVALGLHSQHRGEVLIDGVDRSSAERRTKQLLRRRIALVPQDPLDSFPRGISGQRLLEDALRAAAVPKRARTHRATTLAEEVGLAPAQLAQAAATLSGGQRQRLAIARALAREPELLLLDEPVSALDVTVQARVLDLLDELQRRRGTAYLFVSHDADVIAHMSDRVLRLEGGRITGKATGAPTADTAGVPTADARAITDALTSDDAAAER